MSEKNFTFNFHAPVGQNIANVEHMDVHMDKDGNIQVMNAEQLSAQSEPAPQQPLPTEQPNAEITDGTIDQHLQLFEKTWDYSRTTTNSWRFCKTNASGKCLRTRRT